jgi:LEA14-like dessication related protein
MKANAVRLIPSKAAVVARQSARASGACGLLLFALTSCTELQSNYDAPRVSVNYVKLLPSETLAPRFEIGLHIINPNDDPLTLRGAAYSVSLDGYEILNGVSNDLPIISGYSEEDIAIEAQADLIVSMRFFNNLSKEPRDSFSYELTAKLSAYNFSKPIRIKDTGTISLQP